MDTYKQANNRINELIGVKPTTKQNTMKTNKVATNYIHAEKYLKEYKTYLLTKYGKGFKGSQLTDDEIGTLIFYKSQLSKYTITIEQYVTRA